MKFCTTHVPAWILKERQLDVWGLDRWVLLGAGAQEAKNEVVLSAAVKYLKSLMNELNDVKMAMDGDQCRQEGS